jgi:hypothetical protein
VTKSPNVGRTGARFGSPAMRRRWQQEEAEEAREVPATSSATSADSTASSDSSPDTAASPSDTAEQDEDAPVVGQTGARFAPRSLRRRWKHDEEDKKDSSDPDPGTEPIPVVQPSEQAQRQDADHWHRDDEAEWDDEESIALLVRPYARTGGRTRASYDLPLETLISVTEHRGPLSIRTVPPEWQMIAEICVQPRSVAEVAASLAVPICVARVVIGDMAADGSVIVHRTAGSPWWQPDQALLQQILDGLRRL